MKRPSTVGGDEGRAWNFWEILIKFDRLFRFSLWNGSLLSKGNRRLLIHYVGFY
jgi:hypothetical protein